jgi:ribonuclease HI
VFHSESRCAVDVIRSGSRGATNCLFRELMAHLWKRARLAFDIRTVWARGHNRDIGNDLADRCAGEGTYMDEEACLCRWRPAD